MGNKSNASNAAVRALLTLLGERRDAEVLGIAPGELRGKKIRDTLAEEFDGRCAYCIDELQDNFDVDHIVPINQENLGMQMMGNLAPACKPCNANKKGKNLLEYLEEFHPASAQSIHEKLTKRATKLGSDLDSSNLRKFVGDFYQEISSIVLAKSEVAMSLLGTPSSETKEAAREIQRKTDYDFSEVARQFPVGAFVRAHLDGKVGEVVDYTLEGPIGNRKPHVKFYVAEDDKAYRRSPNQIELIRRSV
jgi:hypothetical protein